MVSSTGTCDDRRSGRPDTPHSGADDDETLESTLDALDSDETPTPQFEVVYDDPADVHRVTRPKSLELLRAIVRHEPESIRQLPTTDVVGLSVDSPSAVALTEALKSPFRFNVPDVSAH